MRKPIYIRPLTEDEQQTLQEGLRSSNAFVLRRCQILLASARGQTARVIAETLGCDDQTVRNVIHAFNAQGLAALTPGPPRRSGRRQPPSMPRAASSSVRCCTRVRAPSASPPACGRWRLAAEVAYAEGLTHRPISGESIRRALARLGVRWKRAKHWITSPDPAYVRKKNGATG